MRPALEIPIKPSNKVAKAKQTQPPLKNTKAEVRTSAFLFAHLLFTYATFGYTIFSHLIKPSSNL